MSLPDYDNDALTIWLFGPGYGELVIVRAPPGAWLVVDGCAADGDRYAQRVLDHYKAKPNVVLFSHPHLDHARGIREVVEKATQKDDPNWPLLGMVPAPDAAGAGDVWNAELALNGGVAEQVIATIVERWRQRPECRWGLQPGSSIPLGDAMLQVLSPRLEVQTKAVAAWMAGKDFDYNRAATALMVRWRRHRVLLGSDLVQKPGKGWSDARSHDRDMRKHRAYKIAHHTSRNAIGAQINDSGNARPRTWLATPFSRSGLPRFSEERGLARHLEVEDYVELTGLPVRHEDQAAIVREATLEQLRGGLDSSTTTRGFPDCYLQATVRSDGDVDVVRGPGAVRVRR